MAMLNIPLSKQIVQSTPNTYFGYEFHTLLEYHIDSIKTAQGGHFQEISDGKAFLFEGDFFGLLSSLSIPDKYHWAVLRCNDLYGPQEYLRSMIRVYIPNLDEIDHIHSIRYKKDR